MKNSRFVRTSVVVLSCLLFTAFAGAANVTVGCAGAVGTFDFSSIAAALQANPGGNVNVTISGTCSEALLLDSLQNVQLIGTAGAAIVDPGDAQPNYGAVLEIDNSRNIFLQDLSIRVATRSVDFQIAVVAISGSDNVQFRGTTVEGAGPSDGIDIFQSTVALLGNTVVENNNDGNGIGEGIFMRGPSASLTLRHDIAGNCPVIQGNGDDGILLSQTGAAVRIPPNIGCATIRNNGQAGIFATQGATVALNASQTATTAVQILNNSFGVIGVVGATVNVNGPVLIQGNTVDGIRLRGNASGALGPAPPNGTAGPVIQQNGTASSNFTSAFCCALPAGVSVTNNSDMDIVAGTITNNAAPGVLVQDNSSMRLVGDTGLSITQNPVGVSVTNVSTAALFLAPSITGNTNFDITCGPDAVAYGDLSAVGHSSCQQFKTVTTPGRPPKTKAKPLP